MNYFRVSVLGSGSKGNATLIHSGWDTTILIDIGFPYRTLCERLNESGFSPTDIDAVLVTHEHIDHIKGVSDFALRHNIPIYGTDGTLNRITDLPRNRAFPIESDEWFNVGDFRIHSVPISHDATDPVGFIFYGGRGLEGQKTVVATDIGAVTPKLMDAGRGAFRFIFEANHDVEMLRIGPYPEFLKRRIVSGQGHLSNEQCGNALTRMIKPERVGKTEVLLAHRSETNNRDELCLKTVSKILEEHDLNVKIKTTSQDRVTHSTINSTKLITDFLVDNTFKGKNRK